MSKTSAGGKCALCGESFAKCALTRHLQACAAANPSSIPQDGFLLLVEGYRPYFLYLAAPTGFTLDMLDAFLRNIWLECCGHLSQFNIDDEYYSSGDLEDAHPATGKLAKVLRPGLVFGYEYDMGSTTELRLSVISELHGKSKAKKIQLLSRNDPPDIKCTSCGQPATRICGQCIYDGKGWLCDECAAEHECGEEMLLPAVNSPRVGVCAYTG